VAVLVFAAGWWIVHRALPQLDGAASLPGLKQEVTVDRDVWGVPHIRASSLEDLLTAQGYVLAQDRLWQMDVLRRVAAGQLAEVFGPVGLERDREFRTLGLYLAADREAAQLDPQMRTMLEAYARGVNCYMDEHRSKLPWEFVAMGYEPRPWRPADSLLIAGYMYQTLTSTWKAELRRSIVSELVGPERAADLYAVDSPLDHVIVGGEQASPVTARAAPGRNPARKSPPTRHLPQPIGQAPRPSLAYRHWPEAKAMLEQFEEEVRAGFGSNNWVVAGTRTASGKPLLANDTHLPLNIPCIWYMLHLTAPGWNVKGFTLPGAPLVIIGHNDRIAWGFTNNGADVQDLYIESFSRTNPRQYLVNGSYVDTQVRTESIHVKRHPDEVVDVMVTRHGPIVQRAGGRAYALRWTATEPGGLSGSYAIVGAARNWEEFRDALRQVPGPAQNAVYADVDGNIGFIVAARIPMRKKGNGSTPVPGDTDDYEWTGYVPFDELPQVLNPPDGMIATANARVVGPSYPHHLTDRWASPYRTARIYELLEQKTRLQPADFLAMQTDIVSLPHRFLAEQLVRASHAATPKDERAKTLIGRVEGWDGRAQANSVETAFVEYTRRALMRNLLRPYLGEETGLYDWREAVFLEMVLRERPARWLPADFHSYDELLMASADLAVGRLTRDTKSSDSSAWRWGRLNALVMLHPLGRSGWRQRLLSIGPMEQAGSVYTVKAAQPSHGPAIRFVADLADFNNSLMNMTLGQSGQAGSTHYRDQFSAWFEGHAVAAPFSDAAEERIRAHRLRLLPGTTH
jgi:penicillin amidase